MPGTRGTRFISAPELVFALALIFFSFDFDLSDILMVMFHKLKFGNWIASILLRYSDGFYLGICLHLGKFIVI